MVDFFNPANRGGLNALDAFAGAQNLGAQREQNELARQQGFLKLDNQRQGALFQDARTINSYLKSNQPERAMGVLSHRMDIIENIGGDPADTKEVADYFARGDYQGAMKLLDSVEQAGIQSGFLKNNEPDELSQINLEKARLELAGMQGGTNKKQTPLEKAQEKADFEFRKEERAVAKGAVVSFNKRASEIRSSFGKVESILNSGKLNRMKIASAMTSMARLLSPGIVTDKDFQNLSNSANPVAELLSKLTGKGEQGSNVAENLQRFYDPTNPDLFDKEAFLTTAKNVAGAEIPSLIDSFGDARSRAVRASISEKALSTNFDQNKNLDFLNDMIKGSEPVLNHPKLGSVTESQIQETMKNKGMTRDQVLALLSGSN